MAYRYQTEAFLQGGLSLSQIPIHTDEDMAWTPSGVQQPWGLAAPAWRLPFEIVARTFGNAAFPDRLALATGISTAVFLLIWNLGFQRSTESSLIALPAWPERLLGIGLCIVFPPILTLFSGPFNVYEEAVTYGYLYSLGLLSGLVRFCRRPSLLIYLLLALLAGLAGFVRPTVLAFGVASVTISFGCSRLLSWPWRMSLSGLGVFAAGVLLLLFTNFWRFGSLFEFGHSLQLGSDHLMYVSRFDSPYRAEPFWRAARELIGAMFFVNELNGFDTYKAGVVAWQSSTPRWRHFYHSAFDWTYLAVLCGCWALVLKQHIKSRGIRSDKKQNLYCWIILAWSLLSSCLLFLFYLRCVVISSRYVLDFAPAIAVALLGALSGLRDNSHDSSTRRTYVSGLLSIVVSWWLWKGMTGQNCFPPTPLLCQREVIEAIIGRKAMASTRLPNYYDTGTNGPAKTRIWKNGTGWDTSSGEVGAAIALFIEDPKRVVLDVVRQSDSEPAEGNVLKIRARIGLEDLRLRAVTRTKERTIVTFAPPMREAYQRGIQILFVSFCEPETFARITSPFRLLAVHWDANGGSHEDD
ncbi:MAG: hypothetical protein MN733_26185 [Nitrososphaera sp.]|nr:hypothetical protein [Nitrososphaera sp.]